MRSRWLLYQKVLVGFHGYDIQRERFEQECYEKGFAEIVSLLDEGMVWSDICWDSFSCFAELYKPLPGIFMANLDDADAQHGNKLGVSRRGSRRNLEKMIIPGSPELIWN